MSGNELSIRPAGHDREAKFSDLYRLHSRSVYAYCARRTGASSVADAVAETFLVAWRRLDKVADPTTAAPWLYGIAYRVLGHQWRSAARGNKLVQRLEGLGVVAPPTPEILVVQREEHRLVIEAASRLRPLDQEVLRLTLWEEMSHADVAIVLRIGVGAAKQRAYRARRNLAAEFDRLSQASRPPAARKVGEW